MLDLKIIDLLEAAVTTFKYAPPIIQIAMVSIVITAIGTLLAYYYMLKSRFRSYQQDKRLALLLPTIDTLIIEEVLTHPQLTADLPVEEVELNLSAFQKLPLHKKWAREALTKRIMHFRSNVKGRMSDLLRALYLRLQLNNEAMKKMKSSHWEKKVQALVEFANMDISIADVVILPLTNSRNREVRAAARHAYIRLSKNDPFKFFDIVTEPILMWDQMELFRIITTTENIAIPNFARWITYSVNKSVVSFCLQLVKHYNQLQAVPAIIKLLETKDHYLRADAINCLGKLKVPDVEDKLVNIYNSQPLCCQIEILKAIGRISSGRYINFLKLEFLHSTDFNLRKNAAKSLVKNKLISAQLMEELMTSGNPENLYILKHCMNPLIKY